MGLAREKHVPGTMRRLWDGVPFKGRAGIVAVLALVLASSLTVIALSYPGLLLEMAKSGPLAWCF